ncbi:MAG: Fe-S protein assembly co-chaperone HscB [Bacteroidota bacterium]|jgi:molecular chaperone HscB
MTVNYYELYQINDPFNIDKDALRKRMTALQREFHPDKFVGATQQEQDTALSMAGMINAAYKTLSNPTSNLHYYLLQQNIITDGESVQLPQAFLMEAMDMGEAIDDALAANDVNAIERIAVSLQAQEKQYMSEIIACLNGKTENSLAKARIKYYELKYILRQQNLLLRKEEL